MTAIATLQPRARHDVAPAHPHTELERLMANLQTDDGRAVVAVLSYRMDAVETAIGKVAEQVAKLDIKLDRIPACSDATHKAQQAGEARVTPVGTSAQGAVALGLAFIDLLKTQPIITVLLIALAATLGASGLIQIIESVRSLSP